MVQVACSRKAGGAVAVTVYMLRGYSGIVLPCTKKLQMLPSICSNLGSGAGLDLPEPLSHSKLKLDQATSHCASGVSLQPHCYQAQSQLQYPVSCIAVAFTFR